MRRRDGEVEFDAGQFRLRARLLTGLLGLFALMLFARSLQLQVLDQQFLAEQGDMRSVRVEKMFAHRGAEYDRFGEPLAMSTPVDTVWVDPPQIAQSSEGIEKLARALKRNRQWLEQRVTSNLDREFLYVARHVDPDRAQEILALGIPGVHLVREYRRYYPTSEVTGHLLGFTNLDDVGQEGLELAFNQSLAGQHGLKTVIKDGQGRIVKNVEIARQPRPGEDLHTSIDLRIQYLAYRELKSAVRAHRARAGSVTVIDVTTGEVLAMVNQPAFNPNDRAQYEVARYKNRVATDIFEPGSSIKPFVVAAALASNRYRPDSLIDTTPFRVGPLMIRDKHDLGTISLGEVLARSSNVGMSKLALSLDADQLHETLRALGFGEVSASGFPGESAGRLPPVATWRPINIATMSYGYGLSVTPLQLAQAYATIGAEGVRRPITFRHVLQPVAGERVMPEKVSRDLIGLLEQAVTPAGTGSKAAVPGYRVAGKTGTAWKAVEGGYSKDRYLAVFAGVVPASQPRLAIVVMIDEPSGSLYYGGDVSAPVFSAVASGALRLMAVAPDDLAHLRQVAHAEYEP
jgi:cell division protein FtsI (penicillin-binding protein 3)